MATCLDVFRTEITSDAGLLPHYGQLPLAVASEIDQLQSRHGQQVLSPFYCALLHVMSMEADCLPLRFGLRPTEEVARLRSRSLQRIREQSAFRATGGLSLDIFLKDMAICRGIMFPAGARIVEVSPGFPRRLLLCAGLTQAFRFLQLLMRMGGNGPCYQLHVHLSELEEFGPSGWHDTLLRLGDMLRLNTGIRGVFASAWFYDPALANVSPNLAYLRHTALQTGAQEFAWGIDKSSNAFVRSKKRRRMFESGSYVPRVYYVIWPRERLIALSGRDR